MNYVHPWYNTFPKNGNNMPATPILEKPTLHNKNKYVNYIHPWYNTFPTDKNQLPVAVEQIPLSTTNNRPWHMSMIANQNCIPATTINPDIENPKVDEPPIASVIDDQTKITQNKPTSDVKVVTDNMEQNQKDNSPVCGYCSAFSPEFVPLRNAKDRWDYSRIPKQESVEKRQTYDGRFWLCTHCGENGHVTSQCRKPSTSYGVIGFRICPTTGQPEYLMICRRHSLGYMDFVRGKMPLTNQSYLMRMINQMTASERIELRKLADAPHLCQKEKIAALIRGIPFRYEGVSVAPGLKSLSDTIKYNLVSLIDDSDQYGVWTESEWGFPKGKRNSHETDYECAIREFEEETGFGISHFSAVSIAPISETFSGSNGKLYQHKYFIMHAEYVDTSSLPMDRFQISEVSNMQWKTYDGCMSSIRPYNVEKKQMLQTLHKVIVANLKSQISSLVFK